MSVAQLNLQLFGESDANRRREILGQLQDYAAAEYRVLPDRYDRDTMRDMLRNTTCCVYTLNYLLTKSLRFNNNGYAKACILDELRVRALRNSRT